MSLANQVEKLIHNYVNDRIFNVYHITQYYEAQFISNSSQFIIDYLDLLEYNEQLCSLIQENYYQMESFVKRGVKRSYTDWIERKRFKMGKIVQESLQRQDEIVNEEEEHESFSVGFRNMPFVRKIRDLRTNLIGKLSTIRGTVTRTSEVLPELIFGRFICLQCGTESIPIEQQFKFTQPNRCQNPTCKNQTKWQLDMNRSVFADWQRVRIQENQNEIPSGSMPRSIDIILRNSCVEHAKAGDKAKFSGMLLVVPDVSKMFYRVKSDDHGPEAPREDGGGEAVRMPEPRSNQSNQQQYASEEGLRGLKSLGVRDLGYKLCFLANHVDLVSSKGDSNLNQANINQFSGSQEEEEELRKKQFISSLTVDDITKISQMKNTPDIYDKLIRSIVPNIYGHEDVKKGVLLMMFGGVHKVTPEGINLRGDLNVCVVGDPGTAKSQFLKYVSSFLPRAVYTSGKASSAAGLTATVVKDNDRGEFTIEAGALMLADNGVCCIDEFDKMDERDQVAIHEAMEQQTISIAKAGIRATLNARTSILAAANPRGGRYNPRKTLKDNLNITAPIMSRFDLFFVVRDECNREYDLKIADHVIKVHRGEIGEHEGVFSTDDLKLYLQYCRLQKPQMSREAKEELVKQYKTLRQQDKNGNNAYRITVRQLESLIRLSEALARLHCADRITEDYVKESVSLLQTSITKVQKKTILQLDDQGLVMQAPSHRATLRLIRMTQKKIEEVNEKLILTRNELTENTNKMNQIKEENDNLSQSNLDESTKKLKSKTIKKVMKDLKIQRNRIIESIDKLQNDQTNFIQARNNLKETTDDPKILDEIKKIEEKSSQSQSETASVSHSEVASSQESKTKKTFQLGLADYKKISLLLIEIMRKNDSKSTKKELIKKYIQYPSDSKPKFTLTDKQLEKMISGIIDRMLKDKVLITVGADNSSILVINPNYTS